MHVTCLKRYIVHEFYNLGQDYNTILDIYPNIHISYLPVCLCVMCMHVATYCVFQHCVSWFLCLLIQPTAAAATVSGACGTGWVEPEHSVSVREAVGGGTNQRRLLVVKVTLPGLHSVSQVQLDVSRVSRHTHTHTQT